MMELWSAFAHFGRVGDVYIPKKLDKQGRKFGFVKYREVRDARELLVRLEDIWIRTFKLRVNLSRFAKGEAMKVMEEIAPEASKVA
jgi:RNA recognition motif-containing protein